VGSMQKTSLPLTERIVWTVMGASLLTGLQPTARDAGQC
jgi:hypothetical protein